MLSGEHERFIIVTNDVLICNPEGTCLREQEVEGAPLVSNPVVILMRYVVQRLDRQGELRLCEERGQIRRIEGRQYQNEYPPRGEQEARRVCKNVC